MQVINEERIAALSGLSTADPERANVNIVPSPG